MFVALSVQGSSSTGKKTKFIYLSVTKVLSASDAYSDGRSEWLMTKCDIVKVTELLYIHHQVMA